MRERLFIRLGVLLAAATIITCGVCLPALAQEGYVGAGYLSSTGEFDAAAETFSSDADGWKIFGGYNFNKYVGAELTYYDLGSFEDTQGNSSFRADVTVFDLGFRGILPLGERFELFAKLGYSNVGVDSTVTGPIATTTVSANDWQLIYGLGVAWKIGQKFGIRGVHLRVAPRYAPASTVTGIQRKRVVTTRRDPDGV